MEKYYYILKNIDSTDDTALGCGEKILRIKVKEGEAYPHFKPTFGNGPYTSINQLKKRSAIYKELSQTNPKRVQQILRKENIIKGKDYIFSKPGKGRNIDFMKSIVHVTKGNIKSKEIYGVHFFDPQKMKIEQIVKNEDRNGVWEAEISFLDSERKNLTKKSTFFPKSWDINRLFNECEWAVENMQKVEGKKSQFKAYTKSNVPVIIIVKSGKLKTIYPIYS